MKKYILISIIVSFRLLSYSQIEYDTISFECEKISFEDRYNILEIQEYVYGHVFNQYNQDGLLISSDTIDNKFCQLESPSESFNFFDTIAGIETTIHNYSYSDGSGVCYSDTICKPLVVYPQAEAITSLDIVTGEATIEMIYTKYPLGELIGDGNLYRIEIKLLDDIGDTILWETITGVTGSSNYVTDRDSLSILDYSPVGDFGNGYSFSFNKKDWAFDCTSKGFSNTGVSLAKRIIVCPYIGGAGSLDCPTESQNGISDTIGTGFFAEILPINWGSKGSALCGVNPVLDGFFLNIDKYNENIGSIPINYNGSPSSLTYCSDEEAYVYFLNTPNQAESISVDSIYFNFQSLRIPDAQHYVYSERVQGSFMIDTLDLNIDDYHLETTSWGSLADDSSGSPASGLNPLTLDYEFRIQVQNKDHPWVPANYSHFFQVSAAPGAPYSTGVVENIPGGIWTTPPFIRTDIFSRNLQLSDKGVYELYLEFNPNGGAWTARTIQTLILAGW